MFAGSRIIVAAVLGALTAAPGALASTPAVAAETQCLASPQGAGCPLNFAGRLTGIAVGASISEGIPERERADVLAHFTSVTDENAFKWSSMQPTAGGAVKYSDTDALVDWAQGADLRLRAHVLFWHRLQTPAWVKAAAEADPDPAARLRAMMTTRVNEVVGRYRGRVAIYDVVNEPLETFGPGWDLVDSPLSKQNFFYTILGEQYIDHAFRAARAADPEAKLALNETVWNPAIGDPKADAFLQLVTRLKQRGVPVDTVGLQTHGMFGLTPPFFPESTATLKAYIDALGKLGVTVEITELDVSIAPLRSGSDPYGAQAEQFRKVALACAQSRHCTGLTTWNIRDTDSWLDTFWATAANAPNEPLLLDGAGNPKPSYTAVRSALLTRCSQKWIPRADAAARPCSTHWPYLSPRSAAPKVSWRYSKANRTLTATVSAAGTTPYGIAARGNAARSRRSSTKSGRCRSSAGRSTCTLRLPAGRWTASVSSRLYGVSGSAATRPLTVR